MNTTQVDIRKRTLEEDWNTHPTAHHSPFSEEDPSEKKLKLDETSASLILSPLPVATESHPSASSRSLAPPLSPLHSPSSTLNSSPTPPPLPFSQLKSEATLVTAPPVIHQLTSSLSPSNTPLLLPPSFSSSSFIHEKKKASPPPLSPILTTTHSSSSSSSPFISSAPSFSPLTMNTTATTLSHLEPTKKPFPSPPPVPTDPHPPVTLDPPFSTFPSFIEPSSSPSLALKSMDTAPTVTPSSVSSIPSSVSLHVEEKDASWLLMEEKESPPLSNAGASTPTTTPSSLLPATNALTLKKEPSTPPPGIHSLKQEQKPNEKQPQTQAPTSSIMPSPNLYPTHSPLKDHPPQAMETPSMAQTPSNLTTSLGRPATILEPVDEKIIKDEERTEGQEKTPKKNETRNEKGEKMEKGVDLLKEEFTHDTENVEPVLPLPSTQSPLLPLTKKEDDLNDTEVKPTTTPTTTAPGLETSSSSPSSVLNHPMTPLQHKHCLSTLRVIKRLKDAAMFLLPVDPVKLNIPDYFDVILHPMDLSTMEKKLIHHVYTSPAMFLADFQLMIDNCLLYNGTTSIFATMANNLKRAFDRHLERLPPSVLTPNLSSSEWVSSSSSSSSTTAPSATPTTWTRGSAAAAAAAAAAASGSSKSRTATTLSASSPTATSASSSKLSGPTTSLSTHPPATIKVAGKAPKNSVQKIPTSRRATTTTPTPTTTPFLATPTSMYPEETTPPPPLLLSSASTSPVYTSSSVAAASRGDGGGAPLSYRIKLVPSLLRSD
ncbi:hypothetical protein HMI54_007655 [Coelomomyces lativittatus]|nr:hypothetical protein HMI54_007655 [Coelomomyces lativittatus]